MKKVMRCALLAVLISVVACYSACADGVQLVSLDEMSVRLTDARPRADGYQIVSKGKAWYLVATNMPWSRSFKLWEYGYSFVGNPAGQPYAERVEIVTRYTEPGKIMFILARTLDCDNPQPVVELSVWRLDLRRQEMVSVQTLAGAATHQYKVLKFRRLDDRRVLLFAVERLGSAPVNFDLGLSWYLVEGQRVNRITNLATKENQSHLVDYYCYDQIAPDSTGQLQCQGKQLLYVFIRAAYP